MRFTREIGEKGQVVIPKDIRVLLGVRPRQKIVFEVLDNEIKIKQEEDSEKFLKEFLSLPKLKKHVTLKDLKKLEEESYDLP